MQSQLAIIRNSSLNMSTIMKVLIIRFFVSSLKLSIHYRIYWYFTNTQTGAVPYVPISVLHDPIQHECECNKNRSLKYDLIAYRNYMATAQSCRGSNWKYQG